jgi:hypothetical protein
VEKGLLLHRVHVHRTGVAIHQAVILPIPVFPHPAKSSPSLGNDALPGAKLALDFPIFQRLEMRGKPGAEKTFFSSLGTSRGRKAGNGPE